MTFRYQKDSYGRTMLMLHAACNEADSPLKVRFLLAKAALYDGNGYLDLRDLRGNTALHYALHGINSALPEIRSRRADIARQLLWAGIDVFAANKSGYRATDFVDQDIGRLLGLPFSSLNRKMQGIDMPSSFNL